MAQAELKGNLQFMSLGTLISINCNENRTIRLDIQNEKAHADIFIQDGNIIHAVIDSDIGEQAFYKILNLKKGTFSIYPDEISPQVSINKNWSTLLLEGTRKMDENAIDQSQEIDWSNFQLIDSDTKHEEKIIDEQMQLMVKSLRHLKGVLGVSVVSRDANVLESDAEYNTTKYAARANAILKIGQKIGSFIGVDYMKYALISNAHKTFIINRKQDSIILLTKKDVTPELLLDEIYNIIKRYC